MATRNVFWASMWGQAELQREARGSNFRLTHLRFPKELDGGHAPDHTIVILRFCHSLSPSLPAIDWGPPAYLAAVSVGQLGVGNYPYLPIGGKTAWNPVMPAVVVSNSTTPAESLQTALNQYRYYQPLLVGITPAGPRWLGDAQASVKPIRVALVRQVPGGKRKWRRRALKGITTVPSNFTPP